MGSPMALTFDPEWPWKVSQGHSNFENISRKGAELGHYYWTLIETIYAMTLSHLTLSDPEGQS